jgi:hypothetical protein
VFCQQLAQQRGDVYSFAFFNTVGAISLLHQGAWREMQQSVFKALAMTERNAIGLSGPSRQMVTWLHVEALDFEGARKQCEEFLEPTVENHMTYAFGRVLLAKACLGLHDYPVASAQLADVTNKIAADGLILESFFSPFYIHTICEYCLKVDDLAQARELATRLYEMTAPRPERTYLALAHRLLAKIAMEEDDLEEAKTQLSRAVSILGQGEFLLAAWRVYVTAAELYGRLGEAGKSAEFRCGAEKVIQTLSENFESDDPLRSSLLAGFAAEIRRSEIGF